MKRFANSFIAFLATLVLALSLVGCAATGSASSAGSSATSSPSSSQTASASSASSAEQSQGATAYVAPNITVDENGEYTDKDSVALYIHRFGHLPSNYVTKTKARKAGWVSSDANLWDVLPGKSIGGGRFYNDEGALPDASGREWFECDIGYEGGYRNAKRIVYSNDGLVYYTGDHYETFERLY